MGTISDLKEELRNLTNRVSSIEKRNKRGGNPVQQRQQQQRSLDGGEATTQEKIAQADQQLKDGEGSSVANFFSGLFGGGGEYEREQDVMQAGGRRRHRTSRKGRGKGRKSRGKGRKSRGKGRKGRGRTRRRTTRKYQRGG